MFGVQCRQADVVGYGGELGVEVGDWRWAVLGAV